jgi:hypothetical protein
MRSLTTTPVERAAYLTPTANRERSTSPLRLLPAAIVAIVSR